MSHCNALTLSHVLHEKIFMILSNSYLMSALHDIAF